MTPAPDNLPDDTAALRAALAAEQLARHEAEARASGAEAMVAHLRLLIARLKRDRYAAASERGRRLTGQMELELGDLVTAASEDVTKAEKAADKEGRSTRRPGSPPRGQPVRAPLPAHLPRERVVLPSPTACPCCGGKLSKLGEDITDALEVEPIRWKVIQTVRERFSCRSCEAVTQPPAPFHPIARGRAGPSLLAMILEAKFGQHQPLNRQSEAYAFQGIELGVSTIADWVGTCTAKLAPLNALIEAHVLAAERLHGDDTTVPVLAKGKTVTGRVRTYVRDDRPFGGRAPPAAMFRYSRDRTAEHPNRHLAGYAGILQADAYAGYNALYEAGRKPGPITEAACWAHGRRKPFELAELSRAPLAVEAVRAPDRRHLRRRARHQRPARRGAARRPPAAHRAAGRRARDLDAREPRQAVPPKPGRQGDGLHADALGSLRAVPRRRPDLPHEQRSRTGAAWYRPRQEVMAVRRQRPRRRPGRGGDRAAAATGPRRCTRSSTPPSRTGSTRAPG